MILIIFQDEKKFKYPVEADWILQEAVQLAAEANSSRQFTDTDNFKLICGNCDTRLKGELEAVQHAKSTGHSNFQEYAPTSK